LGYWRRIARTQREIEMLRRWIERDQINGGDAVTGNVGRMAAWVQARLMALEESIAVDNVDRLLASRNLFPEIDDLIDPLGEPPKEPQYSWQL